MAASRLVSRSVDQFTCLRPPESSRSWHGPRGGTSDRCAWDLSTGCAGEGRTGSFLRDMKTGERGKEWVAWIGVGRRGLPDGTIRSTGRAVFGGAYGVLTAVAYRSVAVRTREPYCPSGFRRQCSGIHSPVVSVGISTGVPIKGPDHAGSDIGGREMRHLRRTPQQQVSTRPLRPRDPTLQSDIMKDTCARRSSPDDALQYTRTLVQLRTGVLGPFTFHPISSRSHLRISHPQVSACLDVRALAQGPSNCTSPAPRALNLPLGPLLASHCN